MKKALTRGEKWLFASPVLLLIIAGLIWRPQPLVSDALELPHSDNVETMEFSPDSKRLVTFSRNADVPVPLGRVYDVDALSVVSVLDTPASSANPLTQQMGANRYNWPAWSKDATRISANNFGPINNLNRIAIWDADSGKVTADHQYPSDNKTTIRGPLRFSSDGKTLLGDKNSTPVFDAASGKLLKQTDARARYRWNIETGNGDGSEEWEVRFVRNKAVEDVRVIDSKTKRLIWKFPIGSLVTYKWFGDVLCIYDIQLKNSPEPTDVHRLTLWNGRTRQQLPSPPLLEGATNVNFLFNPDGNTLLSFSGKSTKNWLGKRLVGELTLWDYRANRVLWSNSRSDLPADLEWSPDGKWLVMLIDNLPSMPCQVFDKKGNLRFKDKRNTYFIRFSPDSKKLAKYMVELDKRNDPLSSHIEIQHLRD